MGGHSPSKESGSADDPTTTRSKVTKVRGEGGIVDFIKKGGVVGAIGRKIEDVSRPYNTKRRKEFISKYNTSVPPTERINMTDEEIGSSKGLASLRDVGYKTVTDMSAGGGGDNQDKSMEQPKVASQMDNTGVKSKLVVADKVAPTDVEMPKLTDDERMIRVKRGKKTRTVLTNDLNEKPKLAKKVLLGIDNNVVS
jgi:hypothetical protein